MIGGAVYYDGWSVVGDGSGTLNLCDSGTFTNYGDSADAGYPSLGIPATVYSGVVVGGVLNTYSPTAYVEYGFTSWWSA